MFEKIRRFLGFLLGTRKVIADYGDIKLIMEKRAKKDQFGVLKVISSRALDQEEVVSLIKDNLGEITGEDDQSYNLD